MTNGWKWLQPAITLELNTWVNKTCMPYTETRSSHKPPQNSFLPGYHGEKANFLQACLRWSGWFCYCSIVFFSNSGTQVYTEAVKSKKYIVVFQPSIFMHWLGGSLYGGFIWGVPCPRKLVGRSWKPITNLFLFGILWKLWPLTNQVSFGHLSNKSEFLVCTSFSTNDVNHKRSSPNSTKKIDVRLAKPLRYSHYWKNTHVQTVHYYIIYGYLWNLMVLYGPSMPFSLIVTSYSQISGRKRSAMFNCCAVV